MAKKPRTTSDPVLKFLKNILPYADREDLLSKLARCWRQVANVDAAVISTWDIDNKTLTNVVDSSNHETLIDRHSFEDEQTLDKKIVLNDVCSLSSLADLKVVKNRLFPGFENAALFLFSKKTVSWGENENRLMEMSALLLRQAEADYEKENAEFEKKLLNAKLEAMAELAAGAGHEVNNPLGTITGRVQLLLKNETDPEKRRALLTIGSQAHRARDMMGDLMLFGRPPAPELEDCDLSEVVREVSRKVEHRQEEKKFHLSLSLEESVPMQADAVQLETVVHELFRNSFEAIEENGKITIETSLGEHKNESVAVLKVSDNGQGLDEIEREHLFDPFFSGRQAGRGLGFGLSKCWRIVSNHQGEIAVCSRPGLQTVFTVHWPVIPRIDLSCDTSS